ncbi:P-type E1-E2 ATPase/heavy metal translocating P-type ATPase [Ruminiclostridium sufflavum DSM 19573]|uniref:Cd(2+)-exporting ATPase n=1 Tax=Ruminiclostridium sufflavum DSM 19573 TaxID=1121337 RepID=A0A318XTK8_9FIRM|nr:cation-translocating P-type ATPase [Ruminiclostridium sufflavum]PYG90173.1 P-type E1-E2 ATPase/heavy metal translocating P-type ATPase [Ruminiclostridium sufflavum DSM 19573]
MKNTMKTTAQQVERFTESALTDKEQKRMSLRMGTMIFAGMIWLSGIIYRWCFPEFESVTGIIMLIGAVIASFNIFLNALKGFISKSPYNMMEQLVSLALLASIAKGDYQIAILIPLIMSVVHFLEERSILGAKSAIEGLKTLQAEEACLITQEGEHTVKAEVLLPGDIILIRPGDMIPADGEVAEGNSSIDQSSLTGETVPEDVCAGAKVYAGTVNIQGTLKVLVTKKVDETSLSKVVELLKKTEQSKTSAMRIIERYSEYYLPLIIIIAIGVLFLTQDMNRVIAIFVVACPCAQILVSSTAMIASLAVASRNGILIKNSKFLEVLGDVKTVIFDKTGTLTAGRLDLKEVIPVGDTAREAVLCSAASVAWASNHPVSRAIIRAAQDLNFEKADDIKENAGLGVTAMGCKGMLYLGNRNWLKSCGLELPKEPVHYGPVVWVAERNKVLGCILLADYIRTGAKEAVDLIRGKGIGRIVLVTGDRKEAAEAIKDEIGLDDVFSDCLPADKLEIVKKEKAGKNIILAVGDGINDALALSESDVGVAMGAMGSDIAVQSADIALMGNELEKISFVIGLSRKTKSIIYQNMVIASSISAIMLIFAGTGIVTPLLGAFLHNIGAFSVLLNSSRLLKFSEIS